MMKKLTAICLLLALSCAGCGPAPARTGAEPVPAEVPGQAPTEITAPVQEPEAAPQAENAEGPAEAEAEAHSSVLVAYFSATGTTRGVAEKIAAITGGALYELQPAQIYTDADLNWHDSRSRSTLEQNDKAARPELAGEPVSPQGYTTVYIGYPIWWGEEPRIVDTFVESCDFDGVTVIPFCTSGGSGLGRSGKNLEENAGNGRWLEGRRFSGGVSEAELRAWIDGLQ